MKKQDYLSKVITIAEASRKYGLSDAHLRRLMGQGKIRGRHSGGTWLLDLDSLLRYLKTPRHPGRKPKRALR